jgi:hypothetical protein
MRARHVVWWVLVPAAANATSVQFPYQGRLIGPDGRAVDGSTSIVVTLWDDAALTGSGHVVHEETFPDVPVQDGYFQVVIGVDTVNNPLDSAEFARPGVWASVSAGAASLPRHAIHEVPRAAWAEVAGAVPREVASGGAPCPSLGALRFDVALDALMVCRSTGWSQAGGGDVALVTSSGGYLWADGLVGSSCLAYLQPGSGRVDASGTGDGVYWIDPDGPASGSAFLAYCDIANGGWTLVAKINGDDLHNTTGAFGTSNLLSPTWGPSGKHTDATINLLAQDTWRLDKFSSAAVFLQSYTEVDAAYGVTEWYSVGHPSVPAGSQCGAAPNNYCGQRAAAGDWGGAGFLWYHTFSGTAYSGLGYNLQKGLLWAR